MNKQKLYTKIEAIMPTIKEIRRELHKNPELAGVEFKTSRLLRESLSDTAIELQEPFLETDVVAILNGSAPGKQVSLRADMDALPVQEHTSCEYASQLPGIMHGCGHDGHMAILLGTALVLHSLRDTFAGSVRFIFQPGEEVAALGKRLVEAGVLTNPHADAVFAVHSCPWLPVGHISAKAGAMMAAAGFFKITIIGKGGHGSMPDQSIDSILIGARVVEHVQSIVSRVSSPADQVVLSVCSFNGGNNPNVLPDRVVLEGTLRYINPFLSTSLIGTLKKMVEGVVEANGARCIFEYEEPYIPTVNDDEMYRFGKQVAQEVLGGALWHETETVSMGGEDFSYYLREVPGAFFWLGMGEGSPGLHNPRFDFNDDALQNGIAFMASLALKYLEK